METEAERVQRLVTLAKLDASELASSTQMLHFDSAPTSHTLMQVEPELLEHILDEENDVCFRGDADDCLVLCTSNATYDVKEAETSNSMLVADLVLPGNNENPLSTVHVSAVSHNYLEAKLRPRPPLNKLYGLLMSKARLEDKFGLEEAHIGVDLNHLLDTVQASKNELERELKELHAVLVEDKYYMLDTDYEIKLVSHMTNLMYENDWSHDSVPLEETLDTLAELEPRPLLAQVFDFYFEPSSNDKHALRHPELSRLHGVFLLERGSEFVYDDFIRTWQDSLPEGVIAKLEHLRGLALVDKGHIRLFREQNLPENVNNRLQLLFGVKSKWSIDEITPYVEKIAGKPGVKALLAKHAKMIKVDGVQCFMNKHAH